MAMIYNNSLASTLKRTTSSSTMNCPPPSPPMKASGGHPTGRAIRPPKSTVDNQQKQQLLEKLRKTSASSSTMVKAAFKIPTVPTVLSPPAIDSSRMLPLDETSSGEKGRPGNVDQSSASSSHKTAKAVIPVANAPSTANAPDPVPLKQPEIPRKKKKKAKQITVPRRKAVEQVRQVVEQVSEAEMMRKEFRYTTPEQIELHKRINKHVNGYMKKACGIPGGVRAYTEAKAATASPSPPSIAHRNR